MDRFLFEESITKQDVAPPIPTEIHSIFFAANPQNVILGNSHNLSRVYMENTKNDARMIDHTKANHEHPGEHVCNVELCRINYILKNGAIVYIQFSYRTEKEKLHGRKFFNFMDKEAIEEAKKKAKKDKLLKAAYFINDEYYELANVRFEKGELFTSISIEIIDSIKSISITTSDGEKMTIGEISDKSPALSNSDWNPAPRKTITKMIPMSSLSFSSAGFNGKLVLYRPRKPVLD